MKTRSNMPLFVVECSDIKTLSNSQIDLLRCGDYLVKKDASGEHAYKVSYKKDKVGICLTYCDGSGYIETASYDYTGGNWVFNSLDVFHGDAKTDKTYVDTELAKKANLSGASFTGAITSPSIIEDMSGYSFSQGNTTGITYNFNYAGVVKNGNKITFAVALDVSRTASLEGNAFKIGSFGVPQAIANKLYPQIGSTVLSAFAIYCSSDYNAGVSLPGRFIKFSNEDLTINVYNGNNLTIDTTYYLRFEATFLLSENLAE